MSNQDSSKKQPIKVLVVDDSNVLETGLTTLLSAIPALQECFRISTTDTFEKAVNMLRDSKIELLITDNCFPKGNNRAVENAGEQLITNELYNEIPKIGISSLVPSENQLQSYIRNNLLIGWFVSSTDQNIIKCLENICKGYGVKYVR